MSSDRGIIVAEQKNRIQETECSIRELCCTNEGPFQQWMVIRFCTCLFSTTYHTQRKKKFNNK